MAGIGRRGDDKSLPLNVSRKMGALWRMPGGDVRRATQATENPATRHDARSAESKVIEGVTIVKNDGTIFLFI